MSARSLNKVLLIGNLTRDPELRYTPQGTAVCQFGLATNREWTDSSGQKQEGAEFHQLVAWGKLAEICSQILNKGRKIFVEGRLQTRAWKSSDGQDRKTTEVVVEEMIALDAPRGAAQMESYESYVPEQPTVETQAAPAEEIFTGDSAAATDEDSSSAQKGNKTDVADEIPF